MGPTGVDLRSSTADEILYRRSWLVDMLYERKQLLLVKFITFLTKGFNPSDKPVTSLTLKTFIFHTEMSPPLNRVDTFKEGTLAHFYLFTLV